MTPPTQETPTLYRCARCGDAILPNDREHHPCTKMVNAMFDRLEKEVFIDKEGYEVVSADFARTLERELLAARSALAEANARIKELEKKLHWTECQKINAEY